MTASARIHLNTAGAGIPSEPVVTAMREYAAAEVEFGPYEAEERHAQQLGADVYRAIGELVGAAPSEIAVFGSATEAWCRTVCHLRIPTGSRVWTTPYEYAGNLIALREICRRTGSDLQVVPTLMDGDLDLDWMRRNLDRRVALVSIVHAPSSFGTILPAAEIGALLTGSGAVYALDACQTVGQLPLDVTEIGCDLLTGAGRKFLCGPRGSGFAYVSQRIWDQVDLRCPDLHAAEADGSGTMRLTVTDATRFETAERNGGVVLGLLAAARDAARRRVTGRFAADPAVLAALVGAIECRPGVRLLTPGKRIAGVVSFVHDTVSPQAIRVALANRGVNGWVGIGSHTPVYMEREGIRTFVRTSVHHYNDLAQIDTFARVLRTVLAQ